MSPGRAPVKDETDSLQLHPAESRVLWISRPKRVLIRMNMMHIVSTYDKVFWLGARGQHSVGHRPIE